MLQFLAQVFKDLSVTSKSSKRRLLKFIEEFIMVLARCIPHHLNEEIFQVCELALDLKIALSRGAKDFNDGLRETQVNSMLEALTDKFTMRSKAHKRLIKYFLQTMIIEESLEQLKDAAPVPQKV